MWENDDLHAEDLVKELQGVLSRRYGYLTTFGKIPYVQGDQRAFEWTSDTLSDFKRRNDGPNNLMIFYYSGHADCPAPYKSLDML